MWNLYNEIKNEEDKQLKNSEGSKNQINNLFSMAIKCGFISRIVK